MSNVPLILHVFSCHHFHSHFHISTAVCWFLKAGYVDILALTSSVGQHLYQFCSGPPQAIRLCYPSSPSRPVCLVCTADLGTPSADSLPPSHCCRAGRPGLPQLWTVWSAAVRRPWRHKQPPSSPAGRHHGHKQTNVGGPGQPTEPGREGRPCSGRRTAAREVPLTGRARS